MWLGQALAQTFVYTEPGNAACPVLVVPPAFTPKPVKVGASVVGSISVSCSFSEGSYTVSLTSTDPNARFSPKSFLVNFGSLSGPGKFTVKFASTSPPIWAAQSCGAGLRALPM
jgi:hypothetical protein